MNETPLTLSIHGLQIGLLLTLVGFAASQHKIWTRMKDRLNVLWKHHVTKTGDPYSPLENGK